MQANTIRAHRKSTNFQVLFIRKFTDLCFLFPSKRLLRKISNHPNLHGKLDYAATKRGKGGNNLQEETFLKRSQNSPKLKAREMQICAGWHYCIA